MNNILVIRFSSLGDVVMTTSVVEALHRKFPTAHISFLTKNLYTDVFNHDERITRVIGINGHEHPRKIIRLLGETPYDVIVDLHSSLRSRMVSLIMNSPVKLRVKKHSFLRRIMVWSRLRYRRSFDVIGSYLETIAPLGIIDRTLPYLIPSPDALRETEMLLQRFDNKVIGFAPGAKHPVKRWDEISYARLADEVSHHGYSPLFIGDTNDSWLIERIRGQMVERSLSLAGRLSLAVTVAVISRLSCLVTNDSGPMHIAGALGVPFVAIFGPTHPDLGFVPGYPSGRIIHSGVLCSPCSVHGQEPCRMETRKCMDAVTWELVFNEIENLVG